MNIIFTDITENLDSRYYPQPASKFIPEWYKELSTYIGNDKKPLGNGMTSGTIKKCMPVFDALTAGYIIPTYTDIFVTQKQEGDKNYPYYEWNSGNPIEFHNIDQAPTHPKENGAPFPKWINPWIIKTPKDYSILVTSPFHHKTPFTILDGIVDTDIYHLPINFPFVLNDINFEGLIPAGTPMAQIIPVKRDIWEIQIEKNNVKENDKFAALLRSKIFDSYKTLFRSVKDYK